MGNSATQSPVPDAEGIGPPTGLVGEYPVLQRVEGWLELAPAAILFAMMALTFANVFLCYLFRMPFSGALEILSYLMRLLVFLSLPLVTARGEHVRGSACWIPAFRAGCGGCGAWCSTWCWRGPVRRSGGRCGALANG